MRAIATLSSLKFLCKVSSVPIRMECVSMYFFYAQFSFHKFFLPWHKEVLQELFFSCRSVTCWSAVARCAIQPGVTRVQMDVQGEPAEQPRGVGRSKPVCRTLRVLGRWRKPTEPQQRYVSHVVLLETVLFFTQTFIEPVLTFCAVSSLNCACGTSCGCFGAHFFGGAAESGVTLRNHVDVVVIVPNCMDSRFPNHCTASDTSLRLHCMLDPLLLGQLAFYQ